MTKAALRLVETSFFVKEMESWNHRPVSTIHRSIGNVSSRNSSPEHDLHSLHTLMPWSHGVTGAGVRPEVAAFIISKYSQKDSVVLDPFCGYGSVLVEAGEMGRRAIASDRNPLSIRMNRAKSNPADLTEVTLFLQQMNLRRPISLESYRQTFSPFFDSDTYREIVHLRDFLLRDRSQNENMRVGEFVQVIAMSLLHGHNAGYFSTYSYPQVALSPEDQETMNARRRQTPDYRSIVPRILRKTAQVLRDSHGSFMTRERSKGPMVLHQDARNLSGVPSGSVDLVITAPPLPRGRNVSIDQWLRFWFAGITTPSQTDCSFSTLEEWSEFMNEILTELARTVRPGGRTVFDLRQVRFQDILIAPDELLVALVKEQLGMYWECEGLYVGVEKTPQFQNAGKLRDDQLARRSNRVLVIRRR